MAALAVPRRRRTHALWMLLVVGGGIRWLMISQTPVDDPIKSARSAYALLRRPLPPPPPTPPPPPPPPFWRVLSSDQPPKVVWIRSAGNGKYLSVSARTKVRAAALQASHPRAQWLVLDVVGADGRRAVALRSRLTGQLISIPRGGDDPQLLGSNDTARQKAVDVAWALPRPGAPSRLVALPRTEEEEDDEEEGCLHRDPAQPSPALDLAVQWPCEIEAANATRLGAELPAEWRFEVGELAPEEEQQQVEAAALRELRAAPVRVALGVACRTKSPMRPEQLPLLKYLAVS